MLRSVKVVARKFDVPLPCPPKHVKIMIPSPYSSIEDDDDSDDESEETQFNLDEEVTSTNNEIYEEIFPLPSSAGINKSQQNHSEPSTSSIIARIVDMRKLHDEYMEAEQVCAERVDDEDAKKIRDRLFKKLAEFALGSVPASSQ